MNIKEFSGRNSVALFYTTIALVIIVIGLLCAGLGHRSYNRGQGFGNRNMMQMDGNRQGGMNQGRMMAPASGKFPAGYQNDANGDGIPDTGAAVPPAQPQAATGTTGTGIQVNQ